MSGFTVATVKNSVATSKRLTAKQRAARDQRVVDLFLAGLSHRQVAAKAGISHTMVGKVVKRDLDERMEQRGAVGEALVLAQRQNDLLRAHWDGALGGDVQSAGSCCKFCGCRRKPSSGHRSVPSSMRRSSSMPSWSMMSLGSGQ